MTKNLVNVINNGVVLQETAFNHKFHLDVPEVYQSNSGQISMTDLGIFSTFAQSGYVNRQEMMPFTAPSQRVYVENGMFKWSHATSEKSFYIVEDLSGVSDPGCSGEKFKVAFNMRKFDHFYTIKPDMHLPFEFLVTEDEIIEESPDRYIYTLKVKGVSKDRQFNVKQFLTPGTVYFPVTTYETQGSQTYSSLPEFSGGMRTYFNTVGKSGSQIHISVTRDAAYHTIGDRWKTNLQNYQNIVESYVFKPDSLGYHMSMLPPEEKPRSLRDGYLAAFKGNVNRATNAINNDLLLYTWVPKVELLAARYLNVLRENEAMYGAGGMIQLDSSERVNTSLGLFHQLNMGNEVSYNLYHFTLEKLEYILQSRLQGRVQPFSKNVITIRTGLGGLAWIKDQLAKYPARYGLVWNADSIVQGQGQNNQSLHFATPDFTSFDLPGGMGTVKFELAAALDPMFANESVNPMVTLAKGMGGHRLSSYMFIIDDLSVNAEDGNILELYCKEDWDVTKRVNVGKLPYMGISKSSTEWQGNSGPGFEVYMTQKHKAYFLKDATRSLIIKPINPTTGKPIFTY